MIDPRTGALRYVGQTTNGKLRLIGHLDEQKATEKCVWIRGLLRVGLAPLMVILLECPQADLDVEESAIIAGLRAAGAHLFNIADGGHACSRRWFRKRAVRPPRPARPPRQRAAPRAKRSASEPLQLPSLADVDQKGLNYWRLMALIRPPHQKLRPNRDCPVRSAQRLEQWFERKGTTFVDWMNEHHWKVA